MNKIDILRYVWQHHRPHFRQYSQGKMCKDFGLVLGRSQSSLYIGKPAFSKFLNEKQGAKNVIDPSGRRENESLELYLERTLRENQAIRETIGKSIISKHLFSAQTTVEIDQLFPQRHDENHSAPVPKNDLIILPFGDDHNNELLMDRESEVAKYLRRRLIQGHNAIFTWEISPWSGATYIACSMIRSRKLTRLFDTMIVMRSNSFLAPYDRQINDIAEILSIDFDEVNRAVLPTKIAEELYSQKVFLVIADAFLIPAPGMDGGLINQLLKEISRIHNEKKIGNYAVDNPTRVLLIGNNGHLNPLRLQATISSETPSVPQVDAFAEFQKFWRVFRERRNTHRYEAGGPRLKRAKAMYEATEGIGKTVSTSEIRLHAFLAADITNYEYSDPTSGFSRLVRTSEDHIPFSIRVMHDDIISYLRLIWPQKDDARETKLRSLQYCSTTKHWLSQDVLEELSKDLRNRVSGAAIVPHLTTDAFREFVKTNSHPFSIRSIPSSDDRNKTVHVFDLPNLVKSVAQDQWRLHQPLDRAIAHWRVAKYLYKRRNDKARLQEEFPYLPHWGRSRFFFLGECIRHLIRSCETQATGQISERVSLDIFPAQPEPGASGAVPETVLDYCYANLFQRQLNGNAGFGSPGHMDTTSRVMSKRHGAGKYATELLQLMSHNGEIGVPHPALSQEFHPSFIKECGYATLDLGELETADRCFSRLVETEWKPSIRIPAMLDKALVKSEMMELDTTRELIEEAAKLAESEGMCTDQIQGRIRSRNALLDFLDKNFDEALLKLNKLLSNDIGKADTEQLHLKIAALSSRKDGLQEPMSLCFSALFRETSAGHHHEALGFRIVLARILREQGSVIPAEHVLLSVQNDIYQFGCSERTYLSFLREAGRNLLEQGKAIRAYHAYLRPCLLRALDRKFGRFVASTASLVQETLANIMTARSRQTEDEWNSGIDRCLTDEKDHQKKSRRTIQSIANLDPLFGYYSEDIGSKIESFRKRSVINAEIESINKLLTP